MKAVQLNTSKELQLIDAPIPEPNEDEVLVKVMAAALNHREIWISKGLYPGMQLPCILGADGAGKIEAIGSNVDASFLDKEVIIYPALDWGDNEEVPNKAFRVLGMPEAGTLAEYIAVSKTYVFDKPAYLTWQEAASIPVAYLTAWRCLTRHGRIKENDQVLITGIGGGVAQAGLAFANAFKANIFVTSSSPVKIEMAIKYGAKDGINYKEDDWHKQLKTKSGGIDIVLDGSPSENLDDYMRFLNQGARVVIYGSTGARKVNFNPSRFFLKHIKIIGTAMGSPSEFKSMLAFMDEYKIKPQIHSSFPLEKTKEAIESLALGNQTGKIIIAL